MCINNREWLFRRRRGGAPVALCACVALFVAGPPAVSGDDSVPDLGATIAHAAQLRNQGQWDQAIEALRLAVAQTAADPAARAMAQCRIGKYLVETGRNSEAEQELAKVEAAFPQQTEAVAWSRLYRIDALQGQGRLDAVGAAVLSFLADTQNSPAFQAWGQVKLAEIAIARGTSSSAIPKLEQVITTGRDQYPEPANWARVLLARVCTEKQMWTRALVAADEVVADHAAGKATDEQTAWAMLWKGRALEGSDAIEQAGEPLQMAAALAQTKYPWLVYEAQFVLGQVFNRLSDAEQARGGDWGTSRLQALTQYQAAYETARTAKLSPDKLDWAILQIGSVTRHLGMRERGIAWLRKGIEDPAQMSGTDHILADRIASFMTPNEAETWQAYLISPAQAADPTAPYVEQAFGQAPPATGASAVSHASLRYCYLGKLYLLEGRSDDALAQFRNAVTAGRTTKHMAQALQGMTDGYARKGQYDAARQAASAGAAAWREVAFQGSDADAHAAMEAAVATCYAAHQKVEALVLAEEFVRTLSSEAAPSKACFARYVLMNEYWKHGRLDDAIAAGEDAIAQFRDTDADDIAEILSFITSNLAEFYRQRGDLTQAGAKIDELAGRSPERYAIWASVQRDLVASAAAATSVQGR
jgi:tetratricopeptide (TPR) repeat protein